MTDDKRGRALRSALATSASAAVLLSLGSSPAQAQPQTSTAPVEEVVVTGSRIRQPNLVANSPVAAVSQQELKFQGAANLIDLINNQPQAFVDQGLSSNAVTTGTATISLRDLGPNRTLVLVDGRRLMPGDPNYPYPDIQSIPALLVERVDILTGGASAAYGADAVAGVVNFIMKKNFEGVQIDSQYEFAEHENHQGAFFNPLLNKKGYAHAPSSVTDGGTVNDTVILGANSDNGKGNITLYAAYQHSDPVLQGSRDFSSCTLNPGAGSCGGSGTTTPTDIISPGGGRFTLTPTGARPYVSTTDQFNYAPYNYFQRQDERWNFGYSGHYEIAKYADVYTEFMFLDDHTFSELAPGGAFLGGTFVTLPCNSPIVPAVIRADACAGHAPTDQVTYLPGRRFAEGPARSSDYRHTSYKIDLGLRGDITDNWHYDVYGQYGTALYTQVDNNYASNARLNNATNIVVNSNGSLSCGAGTPANCVPLNLFAYGNIPAAALNYVLVPFLYQGNTKELVVSGTLDGDLGKYGFQSPLASNPVRVALGGEYRREQLSFLPDAGLQAADENGGSGGAILPVNGSYQVSEFLMEASIPLIQDKPFIKDLTLDAGYRYSDYSTSVTTDTYKFEATYAPTSDLRVRGGYNHAVRAPNVIELYASQVTGLVNGLSDPCSGPKPVASLAACSLTGVPASAYGKILDCSANQCGQLTGGNPSLIPESADTYTIGAVITPSMLPGFSATVDYFNMKIEDVISAGVGSSLILSQCLSNGNPAFCSLVHRDPQFHTIWITGGTLPTSGYLVNTNLNSGSVQTKGLDVDVTYTKSMSDLHLPNWGQLTANIVGTYTDSYVVQPFKGSGKYECAGLFGPTCSTVGSQNGSGAGLPKWRHKMRLTWDSEWDFSLSAAWRHIASTKLDLNTSDPFLTGGGYDPVNAKIKSYDYFDLSGNWHLYNHVTFRAGINNVFDKDPPVVTSDIIAAGAGGNTFPGTYDVLGRRIFIGATFDF